MSITGNPFFSTEPNIGLLNAVVVWYSSLLKLISSKSKLSFDLFCIGSIIEASKDKADKWTLLNFISLLCLIKVL